MKKIWIEGSFGGTMLAPDKIGRGQWEPEAIDEGSAYLTMIYIHL